MIAVAGLLVGTTQAGMAMPSPWLGSLAVTPHTGVGKSAPRSERKRRPTEEFNRASGARPPAEAARPNRRATGEAARPTKQFNEAATAPRAEATTTTTAEGGRGGKGEAAGAPPISGPTPPPGARPRSPQPGI